MTATADTTCGPVVGREKEGCLLFAGIPYAAPPTGDLRFRPPQPHGAWHRPRDATTFGKAAPQPGGGMEMLFAGGGPEWDEDCLFLNIQTGSLDGRRPVMVWIHGGGFVNGQGAIPWYNGARLVANGGIVIVSINYRLGALGFLHLGDFDSRFPTSGVNGLLDQVAALQWVRDNIAAFGGDPGNVTIFGESAGGFSVAALMASPPAAGLFHRAIPQSGAAHHSIDLHRARKVTETYFEVGGYATVDDLRAAPVEALLAAQTRTTAQLQQDPTLRDGALALGMPYRPCAGTEALPLPPHEAIHKGSAARVPVLTGTTRDEWNLFSVLAQEKLEPEHLRRRLDRIFGQGRGVVAEEVYRANRPRADEAAIFAAVMTDYVFRIPAIRLAELQAMHCDHTYAYRFSWPSAAFNGRLGACHALEIPFVFDNLDRSGVEMFTGSSAPQGLATTMSEAWTEFAHTGSPLTTRLPDWVPYRADDSRATMELDTECGLLSDPDANERELWGGII